MTNFLLKIVIMFFFCLSPLSAEVVKKFEILGNKRISDETIFMRDGEIIEHRPTSEFFSHPKHALTKEYLRME